MNYTIRIDDNSPKAKSLVRMLKEMADEYPFVNIYEEGLELSENMVQELESRYKIVLKNPESGKNWEEVKSSLLER
jgi:hypothetical protein